MWHVPFGDQGAPGVIIFDKIYSNCQYPLLSKQPTKPCYRKHVDLTSWPLVFTLYFLLSPLLMSTGSLVSLQLKMASSPISVALCSLGQTLSSSSAAARRSMAIFSPARSQASTSTSCVTPSLTTQSSDRADTWTGGSSTLLHLLRWIYVICVLSFVSCWVIFLVSREA